MTEALSQRHISCLSSRFSLQSQEFHQAEKLIFFCYISILYAVLLNLTKFALTFMFTFIDLQKLSSKVNYEEGGIQYKH